MDWLGFLGSIISGIIGGLFNDGIITNSYATGNGEGNEYVGGLVGQIYEVSGTASLSSCYSLGDVSGSDKTGSLIGGVVNTYNGTSFGTVNISDCYSLDKGLDTIGGCYQSNNGAANTNGLDAMLAGISLIQKVEVDTNLQVGINGSSNSQISFNTNFKYGRSF